MNETVDEGDHEPHNAEPEKMRKLFLGGLNYETTDDGLMEYFKKYGKIVDVIVMKFPDTRRSRGFGFVTYSTAYETETCFQDGPHTIDGTKIETKRATPKDEMSDGGRGGRTGKGDGGKSSLSEARRKVFVGGLSYSTTDEGLRDYFSQFGELVDSIVMKFRGFGFVTYASEAMVDECQSNRPHKIDGAVVETKRATPKDDSNKDYGTVKKIFVGGLKDEVDNSDLREYFSRYGTVAKVEQMTVKATGKKRGFGFVHFEDYDSVDKALLEQNHTIKNWRIDIKKAVSKEHMGGRSDDNDFRGPRSGGRNIGNRSPAPWGRWNDDGSGGNFGDGGFGGNGGGQFRGRNQGFGGQDGGFGYGSGQGGGPWDNNQPLNPWQGGQNDGFGGAKSGGFWDNQGGNWDSAGNNRGAGVGFNSMGGGFRGNVNSGGGFGDGGYGGNHGGGMGGPMRNQMGSGNRSSPYSLGGARGGGYDNRGGAGGRW